MAEPKDEPSFKPQVVTLSSWQDIVEHLDAFPPPRLAFDEDGEPRATAWVFRGVSDATHLLEPSIERFAKFRSMGWAALETKILAIARGVHVSSDCTSGPALSAGG